MHFTALNLSHSRDGSWLRPLQTCNFLTSGSRLQDEEFLTSQFSVNGYLDLLSLISCSNPQILSRKKRGSLFLSWGVLEPGSCSARCLTACVPKGLKSAPYFQILYPSWVTQPLPRFSITTFMYPSNLLQLVKSVQIGTFLHFSSNLQILSPGFHRLWLTLTAIWAPLAPPNPQSTSLTITKVQLDPRSSLQPPLQNLSKFFQPLRISKASKTKFCSQNLEKLSRGNVVVWWWI